MPSPAHDALVSRPGRAEDDLPTYLRVSPLGQPSWVDNPQEATAFPSMREAARAALRLPSSFRAFGLPLGAELASRATH